MASDIEQPSQVWELERHLTKRRIEIDETYDYRYLALLPVFGTLIYRGRLREEELRGLADEKLEWICRVVAFASEH